MGFSSSIGGGDLVFEVPEKRPSAWDKGVGLLAERGLFQTPIIIERADIKD